MTKVVRAAVDEDRGEAGTPYANVVRAPEQEPRQPGMLKHRVIPEAFWDPLTEEELALFEGSETDEWGISLPETRARKSS